MFRVRLGNVGVAVVGAVAVVAASAGTAMGQKASNGPRNGMVKPAGASGASGGRPLDGDLNRAMDRSFGSRNAGGSDRRAQYFDRGDWNRGKGYGHGTDIDVRIDIGGRRRGWDDCDDWKWRRRDYCPPPVVVVPRPCPPPVVVLPRPCPPPVTIIRDDCDDDWGYRSRERTIIVDRPRVVERTVIVEKPVIQERIVERPVIQERIVEKPVVIEKVVEREPETRVAPEPGSYRDRELGDAYLRMADYDSAARVYRRYLAAWASDGTATRNFGLALVGRGDVREGFAAVVQGYALEPELFKRPLRPQDVGGPLGLQALIDQAARSADGINSADAWFTLAVLRHFAGQRDESLAALQRAKAQGLPTATLDSATLEFSR